MKACVSETFRFTVEKFIKPAEDAELLWTSQFTIGYMAPASVWVIGHSFVRRARPFFNLYRSRAQDAGLRFLWIARGGLRLDGLRQLVKEVLRRRLPPPALIILHGEAWLVGKPTRPMGGKESCLVTKQVDNLGIKNTSAGELKTVSAAFWLKPGLEFSKKSSGPLVDTGRGRLHRGLAGLDQQSVEEDTSRK
ncbi:hypothetical protein NDU88_002163 [Pleurodeles waltl]|uniref:Uncharacterized protein n=1 Tax=Pleurodeles waltl TaxID=8319 RepID=A0AAV7M1L0_PLEWA|nr:hypothetical protein NDU88_002163 [Pleurodeles waltl]